MSSAFKRKTYGPVKPVKPLKAVPPAKPSIAKLALLYRLISKASKGQHIDYMSKALFWWQDALKYVKFKRPSPSIGQNKALLHAFDWLKKGQAATSNDEKERCFVEVLVGYRSYAKGIVDVDYNIYEYLKLYHAKNKKVDAHVQKLVPRFDSFLTLLSQCFRSCPFTFQVVPDIEGDRGIARKFDHDLNRMVYTRALALKLQKQYRREGLLSVTINEARHISRAMAYEGTAQGKFLVEPTKQFMAYTQLMDDFVEFAKTSPDAPNRLVKRTVDKPKKERTPRVKGSKIYKEPSIASQILDSLTQKGLDNV